MVTPLKKHHGQNGGMIALLLLVATIAVVWTTNPRRPAPASTPPQPKVMPAVSAPLPAPPEPTAVPTQAVNGKLTATGAVSFVDSRTAHVTVPVSGWMRKLHAPALGRKIRAGETVAVVYSPEVYLTTFADLVELRDFRSQEQLDAIRLPLLRWGMRREMLADIERVARPQAALPLIARVSGTVVAEQGDTAQLVDGAAGLELMTITDPSYASLYVDVPAADAARAQVGMRGRVTIDGIARRQSAAIGYVSRRETDGMRTIRFDLHDASARFTPGAHAEVEVTLDQR